VDIGGTRPVAERKGRQNSRIHPLSTRLHGSTRLSSMPFGLTALKAGRYLRSNRVPTTGWTPMSAQQRCGVNSNPEAAIVLEQQAHPVPRAFRLFIHGPSTAVDRHDV
jgi:hypothetical protein